MGARSRISSACATVDSAGPCLMATAGGRGEGGIRASCGGKERMRRGSRVI
jgi:hypothetical protein